MIDKSNQQEYNIFSSFFTNCKLAINDSNRIIDTDSELKDLIAKFGHFQPSTALKYLEQFESLIYFTDNQLYLDSDARYANSSEELPCLIRMLYLFFKNTESTKITLNNNFQESVTFLDIDPQKNKTLEMKMNIPDMFSRYMTATSIPANIPAFKWHIPYYFIPAFISCLLATSDKDVTTCHLFFERAEEEFDRIIKKFYKSTKIVKNVNIEFTNWLDTFLARQYFLNFEDTIECFSLKPENKGILRNYFFPVHRYLLYGSDPYTMRISNIQTILNDFINCINTHFFKNEPLNIAEPTDNTNIQSKIPLEYLYPTDHFWPLQGEKDRLNTCLNSICNFVKEFIMYIKNYYSEHQKPDCPYKLGLNDFDTFSEEYLTKLHQLTFCQECFKHQLTYNLNQAINDPTIKSAIHKGYITTVNVPARIQAFSAPIADKFIGSAIREFKKFHTQAKHASFPTTRNTFRLYKKNDYLKNLEDQISRLEKNLTKDVSSLWTKHPYFFIYHDSGIIKYSGSLVFDGITELNKHIELYKNMLNSNK